MALSTALWAGLYQRPMGLDVFAKSQADQGKYAGKVLAGKYLLTQTLGEGGEGVIYGGHLRYDPGKIYAFKVGYSAALDGFGSDGLPQDPILREHSVLQALQGHYIPKAIESGLTTAGYPFAVRELLPGMSLAKLLKRSPVPSFPNALVVGKALCSAVRSVHEQGMLHRDIKPGNIVIAPSIDQEISLKLIDFAAGCQESVESHEVGTAPLGTPAYMSPERAKGMAAGKAGDLYSVGAILYELFTGKAILGPDAWNMETARQILGSDVPIPAKPLQTYRPDIPPELSHAINRMVSRDPADRTVQLSELEMLLSAYLRKDQIDASWFALPRRRTSQITALPQPTLWERVSDTVKGWFGRN